MKSLLIILVLFWAVLPLMAQTAKAPARKPTATKTPVKAPANTRTALPNQSKSSGTPPNKATALPSKSTAKPATNPTTGSVGSGSSNATKLPSGSSTVAPSQPTPSNYSPPTTSSASVRSSYRASSRRSSGGYGFGAGDGLLNLGIGLTNYYSNRMPVGLSYEYGFTDDISAGAQFDYMGGGTTYYYTVTYLGARGSYHFNRLLNLNEEKFDLYAGVGLGYQSWRPTSDFYRSYYTYNSGLFFNYFAGGKYYFTKKVGAFVELGYTGISSSRIGLSLKL